MAIYKIVEKASPLHVHAHCETLHRARYWIDELAPAYCAKGYFMDKTLTPESFEIRDMQGNVVPKE